MTFVSVRFRYLSPLRAEEACESRVGDAGMPEVEPLQPGEPGDNAHGVVVGLGFGQVELREPFRPAEFGQSAAGNRSATDGNLPEPCQSLHVSKAIVAHVVAAEDAEVFNVWEFFQDFQPRIGDLGVFDRKRRPGGESRLSKPSLRR